MKYKYLNDDEAEERFEKRNKTLNYFSIMVSKRIKDQDGEEAEVEEKSKSGRKKKTTVVRVCVCMCEYVCVCAHVGPHGE